MENLMTEYLVVAGQHLVLLLSIIPFVRASWNLMCVISELERGFWEFALSRLAATLILFSMFVAMLKLLQLWGGPVWFVELFK